MESSKYLSEFNLNEKQLKQFEQYLLLLQEWSKKMNLTTITEETEVYIKHFYDSLALSKYLKDGIHLADVGTGAGFPGLPLKIGKETFGIRVDFMAYLFNGVSRYAEVYPWVCCFRTRGFDFV